MPTPFFGARMLLTALMFTVYVATGRGGRFNASTASWGKCILDGLSKQSRRNHTHSPVLVQRFQEESLICPVECFFMLWQKNKPVLVKKWEWSFFARPIIPGYLKASPHCEVMHYCSLGEKLSVLCRYRHHTFFSPFYSKYINFQSTGRWAARFFSRHIGLHQGLSKDFTIDQIKQDSLASHELFSHHLTCQTYMLSRNTPKYNYQMAEATWL